MASTDIAVRSEDNEHRAFRLPRQLYEPIRDAASGVEEGEAGLKSCAAADRELTAGVRFTDGISGKLSSDGVSGGSNALRQLAALDHRSNEDDSYRSAVEMMDGKSPFGLSSEDMRAVVSTLECDVSMAPLERWFDRWARSRRHLAIVQARRTLASLRDKHVGFSQPDYRHFAVLHIVYGPKDPFVIGLPPPFVDRMNSDSEHPLAGLARYTDTVEAWRQEMVMAEARERMAEDDARGLNFGSGRYRHADMRITSGDALRDILDEHIGRGEHELLADYKSRAARGRGEREAVVTMIKVDASRILAEASNAYLEAWRAR
jgi:hypothetical protein